MARIATLDDGESLFFDHRDPAMVSGSARGALDLSWTRKTRTLGQGLEVSAIGLGCMGMCSELRAEPRRGDMIGSSAPPSIAA